MAIIKCNPVVSRFHLPDAEFFIQQIRIPRPETRKWNRMPLNVKATANDVWARTNCAKTQLQRTAAYINLIKGPSEHKFRQLLCIHRSVLTYSNLKILAKLCQICFSPYPRNESRTSWATARNTTDAYLWNECCAKRKSVSLPADNSSSTGNRIWISLRIWRDVFVMFCVGSALGQAFVQEVLLNVYKLEPATRKTGAPRFHWSTPPHRQIRTVRQTY